MYNPCGTNGRCIDKAGDYDCNCNQAWKGKNCDVYDVSAPGGIDVTPSGGHPGRYLVVDFENELRMCRLHRCEEKAGDRKCDPECNKLSCMFDGGDCNLGINPWKRCNATSAGKHCADVFRNQECDEACNTEACLFDGNDCVTEGSKAQCRPEYDGYCSDNYANGKCDEGCNNAACGWDGGDCEIDEPKKISDGSLYIVQLMTIEQFHDKFRTLFERYLSLKLQTNIKVRHDEAGKLMVYPFDPALLSEDDVSFDTGNNDMADSNNAIVVFLEVDNSQCTRNCYQKTEDLANYMAAALSSELENDWNVAQVGSTGNSSPGKTESNTTSIIIGLVVVALVLVCLGVVTKRQKTAKGITWLPEGFKYSASAPRTGHKRPHHDQEMSWSGSKAHMSQYDLDHGGYLQDGWSDDDPNERPSKRQNRRDTGQTVLTEFDDNDQRSWTAQHLSAADVKNTDVLGALTPPQPEINSRMADVDARGPCGLTPLMVASFRGGGLDQSDLNDEEDPDTSNVIQDLIAQGASINNTMDKTGETPLHLAARYARADAAKKLLDAKSDANAIDNTGRTPLHAAVAADAQGVFQILVRHRATNLDARTFDGTTPLILAARLAIEGMVEELIQEQADINASDETGKSALHWAASVNNVDAVNILLANGANRDAQDSKDETPLFLACREGSYQAAKALLDHCANRDITDHMDRLPRDVAQVINNDLSHWNLY